MSGLRHTFQLAGETARVDLDDAIATYLWDTLRWSGLDYYGPSVISGAAAATLSANLRGWIAVFRCGPPTLRLTGVWEQTEEFGNYTKLEIDRDALIETLERIASWADEASRPGKQLLHFGI